MQDLPLYSFILAGSLTNTVLFNYNNTTECNICYLHKIQSIEIIAQQWLYLAK